MSTDASHTGLPILRRVIVWVIILAFGIAALGGIYVLLVGGLDETAGRVLSTTAVIGAYSVGVLCCAALIGRSREWFGYAGIAVTVLTAVVTIFLIWSESAWEMPEPFWKLLWTGVVLTSAWALASLLLLLADRTRTAVVWGLRITLAIFVVLVLLILYLVWWNPEDLGEWFPRMLGVLGILAALGAVTVPVLSIVLPDGRAGEARVSPELSARLLAEAERRGITVDELVAPLFAGTSYLAAETAAPAVEGETPAS